MLTIVIPIKNQPRLEEFIERNREYLSKFPVVIIDSGRGEETSKFATKYIKKDIDLREARRLGYSLVDTKYVLNLDSDVIIPKGYIESAIEVLENEEKVGAVSIHFDRRHRHRGVAEFGISIWRTEIIKREYDYDPFKLKERVGCNVYCECLYMWEKLEALGYYLEVLGFKAEHLEEVSKEVRNIAKS